MARVGAVEQNSAAGAREVQLRTDAASTNAYFDDFVAVEFAEPAWTVATKATPSRVLWSASKTGSGLPYVYAAISEAEKLEIGYRNDAGTRDEDTSAGAVAIGVHSILIEMEAADLVGYVDGVEVCRLTIAGTFTGMDTITIGGMSTTYDGHEFDEKMGEVWGHGGVDFPGYSAYERTELLEHLASVTDGLEVA